MRRLVTARLQSIARISLATGNSSLRSSTHVKSKRFCTANQLSSGIDNGRYNPDIMEPISTANACPVAGPYSQAIKTPATIYVSGQLPAKPDGTLPSDISVAEKAGLCIANIRAILTAAGSDISKVVKVNIFLTSMTDFAEMNGEYEKHFTHKPARSCVAVKELPKGVCVEMECIALP